MANLSTLAQMEPQDLYEFLAEHLRPRLMTALEASGSGQRLRVTTLPEPVMDAICASLQGDPRWEARVLCAGQASVPWKATATKIIELRNILSKPLLVFLPPGLRTAAEDSLDIATFTELSLTTMGAGLVEALLHELAESLRSAVREELAYLRTVRHIRNVDEEIEYLLTVRKNGGTADAAGGALYVFGLLPDFQLFTRGNTRYWLTRNRIVCERLSDAAQPLQARLQRLPVKPNTIQPLLFALLRARHSDIRSWARELACDAAHRMCALDLWEFADEGQTEELRLILEPLPLPKQTEDTVQGTTQLPVLNVSDKSKDVLKVAFRSIPIPSQHPSWKTYRIQILSMAEGQASVAWESNNYQKPQGQGRKAVIRRSVKASDLALDEGTYFLKVDAYDADGAVLTRPRRIGENDDTRRAENESEQFLIVNEDVEREEPDVRAIFVTSLLEAWVAATAKCLAAQPRESVPARETLRGSWENPVGPPPKGSVRFTLTGEGFAGYTVVMPAFLRYVELTVLDNPEDLGLLESSFADVRKLEDVQVTRRETHSLGDGAEAAAFLAARCEVFQAIREHHFDRKKDADKNRAEQCGLVETVDLSAYDEAIQRYAQSYVALVEAAMQPERDPASATGLYTALANLDVVELRWQPGPGDPGRAILVAPTHPLRLFWHLAHTRMCHEAARRWEDGSHKVPEWREFLLSLARDLLPINLPMVIFHRRGRTFVEQAPVSPFWPIYLPDRAEGDTPMDAMAARDRVLRAMGIQDRKAALTAVEPSEIANRLFEYIKQHPYVEQLRLNVINPGDEWLVAEVLRRLETLRLNEMESDGPSLRYAIHLFARAGHPDSMGDGLESLLDPDRQVGEEDEFTTASSNHLLPKLVFARNDINELCRAPERFSAHVTLLLEQFTVVSRVGRIAEMRRGSFVGGLVQEPETQIEVAGTSFGWVKGLKPLACRNAFGAEQLLCAAVSAAQRVQAAYALGQPAADTHAPIVALKLTPEDQSLLKQVHEISDRVLTIDRNLGIDYFDSPSSGREAGYLLDFAPEYLQEDRQRILLTTRSTLELESLICPMLERYGLKLQPGDEVVVLETLRSLSGRFALRLESGPTQAAEVVGLLLARWLLDRVGLLEERVAIPLDAHRSWFTGSSEGNGSGQRADLLLVGFPEPGKLRFDIVEVKLRQEISGMARSQLYTSMQRQAENARRRLQGRFALDLYPEPRADALIRAKELAGVLMFYARRANRYRLLSDDRMANVLALLEQLDEGYTLELHTLGVVFEYAGHGYDAEEEEPGFTVHRFGADRAKQFLANAVGRFADRASRRGERRDVTYVSELQPSAAEPVFAEAPLDADLEAFQSTLRLRPRRPSSYPDHQAVGSATAIDSNAKPHYRLPSQQPVPTPTGVEPQAKIEPVESPQPSAASIPASIPDSTSVPELASMAAEPVADILLGATEMTPQQGILGKSGSYKVALDLTGCNTISLFGVQGFGKSYTLGVIAEMAAASIPGINSLPSPLATVIFHYHKSDAYEPEFASAVHPNRKQSEVERLLRDYGSNPLGLKDVMLLAPEAKVEQRRKEYPGITVEPIKFTSAELKSDGWKFLLGAYGNDALYLRQLNAILRRHRDSLTLQTLREELRDADLSKASLRLAEDRLKLAEPYIDDARTLGALLRPGRTIIVDLRDEWIEKEEALELFVVMLRIFAAQKRDGKDFNKLVVFDEAHKYITESELIEQVVETIREMRHHATSVIIASQDPLSVPRVVVELSTVLVLHRITSPQWLKHLKTAIVALGEFNEGHVSTLLPGEALIWAQRSTDNRFSQRPQKIVIRPRVTQHGGGTKTAVAGTTVR